MKGANVDDLIDELRLLRVSHDAEADLAQALRGDVDRMRPVVEAALFLDECVHEHATPAMLADAKSRLYEAADIYREQLGKALSVRDNNE